LDFGNDEFLHLGVEALAEAEHEIDLVPIALGKQGSKLAGGPVPIHDQSLNAVIKLVLFNPHQVRKYNSALFPNESTVIFTITAEAGCFYWVVMALWRINLMAF
jgi:hypothetical protein